MDLALRVDASTDQDADLLLDIPVLGSRCAFTCLISQAKKSAFTLRCPVAANTTGIAASACAQPQTDPHENRGAVDVFEPEKLRTGRKVGPHVDGSLAATTAR